jgi:hypothetical protein
MSRVTQLILASTLVGQVVLAQPVAQPPPVAPLPGGAQAPGDADISARRRPTLSPQEMVTQANDYRERMEKMLKQVQGLVEQAKKDKDVIRLNCVADKLAQLKANIAVVDRALQDLRDAIGRRDDGETDISTARSPSSTRRSRSSVPRRKRASARIWRSSAPPRWTSMTPGFPPATSPTLPTPISPSIGPRWRAPLLESARPPS